MEDVNIRGGKKLILSNVDRMEVTVTSPKNLKIFGDWETVFICDGKEYNTLRGCDIVDCIKNHPYCTVENLTWINDVFEDESKECGREGVEFTMLIDVYLIKMIVFL